MRMQLSVTCEEQSSRTKRVETRQTVSYGIAAAKTKQEAGFVVFVAAARST